MHKQGSYTVKQHTVPSTDIIITELLNNQIDEELDEEKEEEEKEEMMTVEK